MALIERAKESMFNAKFTSHTKTIFSQVGHGSVSNQMHAAKRTKSRPQARRKRKQGKGTRRRKFQPSLMQQGAPCPHCQTSTPTPTLLVIHSCCSEGCHHHAARPLRPRYRAVGWLAEMCIAALVRFVYQISGPAGPDE